MVHVRKIIKGRCKMTITDVAKLAGVSKTTVSRVLNRRGPLSEKTIKKVEDAMAELGYFPNEHARALSGVTSRVIGVVISAFNHPFHSELLQQISLAVRSNGYSILIASSAEIGAGMPGNGTLGAIEFLLSKQVDAIISMNYIDPEYWPGIREKCAKTPFINLLSEIAPDIPSVLSDDKQGGLLAAMHLRAKGCKKIVHVSGALSDYPYRYVDERSYTFLEECENYGISTHNYEYSGSLMDLESMQELISRIFSENMDMDGIFLSNDIFAAQCVAYAQSLGLRIPDDLRVLGYDGIYLGTLTSPPISTIRQDFSGLAESAVNIALAKIRGEETETRVLRPVKLIERKTT